MMKKFNSIRVNRAVVTCQFYLFFILAFASCNMYNAQNKSELLTTGTSWTAPAGVTSITVQCWGGGGGGGAARRNGGSTTVRGSGGGGGGYTSKTFTVVPGNSYAYSVGLGGNGGTTTTLINGTAGGNSNFTVGASTITANGGLGGPGLNNNGGNASTGGTGGVGINGDVNYNGGNGGTAVANGAGGGGGAGTSANGSAGTNTAAGNGGAGNLNGRGGASQNANNAVGNSGFMYGGGGGGAKANSNTLRAGGSGANGIIRISYCVKPTLSSLSDQEICPGGSTAVNATAAQTSILFSENFENTYAEYFAYDSWTQLDLLAGFSDWYFSSTTPLAGTRSLTLGDAFFGFANSYEYDYFNQSICSSKLIDGTSYSDLKMNFKWKCGGEATYDYGMVAYSLDGFNWMAVDNTMYQGQPTNVQTVSNLALPAALNGQKFYIGFYWENDGSFGGDPGFTVDDISITGTQNFTYSWSPSTGLSADDIASPTANPTSTQTYNVTVGNGSCSTTSAVTVYVGKEFANTTGNWNVATNWIPAGIPTATKCITIPNGKSVVVNVPDAAAKTVTVAAGGKLTINADQSLTIQDGFTNSNTGPTAAAQVVVESEGNLIQINEGVNINTGEVTAKRNVVLSSGRQQYNYLISPVEGQSLAGIYRDAGGNPVAVPFVLYHNEANNKFFTSSGAYIKGRGLAVKEPTAATFATGTMGATFTGKPTNGAFSYTIVNTNTADTNRGYNLIGNPYPSNIDLMAFYTLNGGAAGNMTGTAYFWDNRANNKTTQEGNSYTGQSYGQLNMATGTGSAGTGDITATRIPNHYAKVGQAFMVKSKVASATVNFNNTIRTNLKGTTDFFGKNEEKTEAPMNRYWLNMINLQNIASNIAVVYFAEGNNGFAHDDSRSMGGSDVVYSIVENEQISINGRSNFSNTDVVPLGSKHFVTGNYTIALGDKEGIFASGQNIYLKDTQTGIITNLSEGNYTFQANAGESTGRFEIVYQPQTVLATDGAVKEDLVVYKDGSDFVVKAETKKITALQVFDMNGRLIYSVKPNAVRVTVPAAQLVNGSYLLKIDQSGKLSTKKVIR